MNLIDILNNINIRFRVCQQLKAIISNCLYKYFCGSSTQVDFGKKYMIFNTFLNVLLIIKYY